jgi:MOSC domain-containing protein YiiM
VLPPSVGTTIKYYTAWSRGRDGVGKRREDLHQGSQLEQVRGEEAIERLPDPEEILSGVSPGSVTSLQLLQAHGQPPRAVSEVVAVPGRGLEGDIHGKTREDGKRQVLLMDTDSLEAMGLLPGDLRDQVTLNFPGLQQLPAGTRLLVGEATLELAGPCEPCTHIGELLRKDDPAAFQRLLVSRRGVMARVLAVTGNGKIRVGDPVDILPADEAKPVDAH